MAVADIVLVRKTDYPGKGVRFVSVETTFDFASMKQEPVLEFTDIGDGVLHLSFVRSSSIRSLDVLMQKTLDYAKANRFHRVELRDDAFFKTSAGAVCFHRELFHRAFDGKQGIYESKGWIPSRDTHDMIVCISGFTKAAAKELGPLLNTRLLNSFADNDQGSFGTWINAQPCVTLNYFYNTLMALAARPVLPPMTTGARQFLTALHELRVANGRLRRDVLPSASSSCEPSD